MKIYLTPSHCMPSLHFITASLHSGVNFLNKFLQMVRIPCRDEDRLISGTFSLEERRLISFVLKENFVLGIIANFVVEHL